MSPDGKQKKTSLLKLRVSALEADLAYFAARLELLGRPVTAHQQAQMKTYRALEKAIENILKRLRQSSKHNGTYSNRGAMRR